MSLCKTWLRDDDAAEVYKVDGYCPAQVIKRQNKKEKSRKLCGERQQLGNYNYYAKNEESDGLLNVLLVYRFPKIKQHS